MKQVSGTKNSLVLCSPLHHSICKRDPFSKYRFILLLTCICVTVSSCQKEDLFNLFHEHHKQTVPFKATFETVVGHFSETEDQITGTGAGTPIGPSTFVEYNNFTNFPLLKGTQTLTTENGDQIFSTFSGSAVLPDKTDSILITNNYIITAGTGRFAGATGSFTAHGIATTKPPTGTVTFDGTINY